MCIQQTATTYVTTATTKLTHLLENENNASSSPSSGEATSALAYTGWPKKLGHIAWLLAITVPHQAGMVLFAG